MFAVDIEDALNGIEAGASLIGWKSAQAVDGIVAAEQQVGANGSWIAHLDTGGEIGHFVIVDGIDEFGYVLIRDVAQGTRYRVGGADFDELWSGHWIARQ